MQVHSIKIKKKSLIILLCYIEDGSVDNYKGLPVGTPLKNSINCLATIALWLTVLFRFSLSLTAYNTYKTLSDNSIFKKTSRYNDVLYHFNDAYSLTTADCICTHNNVVS